MLTLVTCGLPAEPVCQPAIKQARLFAASEILLAQEIQVDFTALRQQCFCKLHVAQFAGNLDSFLAETQTKVRACFNRILGASL